MPNITIRASRLPQLVKCSAPLRLQTPTIESSGIAAEIGTAVHEQFARYIAGYPQQDDPFATYNFEDSEADEAMMLFAMARRVWDHHIKPLFPIGVETERYIEHAVDAKRITLTGHIDIGGWLDAGARHYGVVDLKTGRVEDEDQMEQLVAYAFLAAHEYGARSVTAIVFYVRSGNFTRRTYEIDQLAEWFDRVPVRIANSPLAFNPGRHCATCPAFAGCAAQQAMVRNLILALLADMDHQHLTKQLDRWDAKAAKQIEHLIDALPALEKHIEMARELIKNRLLAYGDMELPSGARLTLEQQDRTKIKAKEGWPVLAAKLSTDDLAAIVRISKQELETRIKAQASRGDKKAAVEQVMQLLTDANATETATVNVMRRIPPKKAAASRSQHTDEQTATSSTQAEEPPNVREAQSGARADDRIE